MFAWLGDVSCSYGGTLVVKLKGYWFLPISMPGNTRQIPHSKHTLKPYAWFLVLFTSRGISITFHIIQKLNGPLELNSLKGYCSCFLQTVPGNRPPQCRSIYSVRKGSVRRSFQGFLQSHLPMKQSQNITSCKSTNILLHFPNTSKPRKYL